MKRTLAFLLSLMMVFSLLPASVLATEEAPVTDAPVIEFPAPEETPVEEEAPVEEETPVAEETPAEQPAAEDLELLDATTSIAIKMTTDCVLVTYTVPDMASVTEQLTLFRYDSVSGSRKRVDHVEREDMEDWDGLTYTWVVDGGIFAEHGEGHYYCAEENGTAESSKIEFGYAADAVQLEMPANVTLDPDSLNLTWECNNSVMAVIVQDDTAKVLDYRRVFDGFATISELMPEDAENGIYSIHLFAFSENDYVYNLPSEWATVTYQWGTNPDTTPDVLPDNPDEVAHFTRIQAVSMLVNALELEYDSATMGHITFDDVTDPYDARDAAIAVYHGFASGTSATTFTPDAYVTRGQLAMLLYRALDLPAGDTLPSDVSDAAHFADAMSAVMAADLMFTDAYGNFRPNETATTDDVDPDRIRELAKPSTESDTRGKCGDNLQWELDLSTYVLTITGSGKMYDYTDAPWSAWSEQITAVSLPEGLTHLGGSALYTCGQITELTLPSTLESIGNRAIASCWALESLHIPAKVTDIGSNALGFDISLTEITVDPANTVFRVQNGFLLTMDSKTLVAVPGGLTGTLTVPVGIATLGNHAFCGSLAEQVVLPASLTTIAHRAFFGCNSLESIEIPAGVTQIDEEAFYRCKDLHTVTFLGNAPTLGENVFGGCASGFCIYYDPANAGWSTPEWNGWPACPIGGTPVLPEAPAATKLQWNVGITSIGEKTAVGWFSFYGTNGVDYAVNLYRQDAAGDNLILSKTATPVKGYYNVIPFNYDPTRCQTGDYYFTVQAMGDGNAYADGPIQTSAVWHYTRPNAELVPTDLYWSVDKSMNWNLDETYVLEYHVGVLYNGTEDDLNGARMVDEEWYSTTETPVLSEELLAKYGTGWYYFAVQPITYDPTVTLTPADIFYSNGYYYSNASATLPEAPAATDLQWHTWRNNSGSDSEYQLGAISFGRTDTATEQNFRVDFYRQEASGDKKIGELWAYLREGRPYRTMYPFEELVDAFTTGTYYFTVTALGNGVTTCDGQPVRSGNWSYTRPDTELEVSAPKWDKDMSLLWTDGAQNDGYVDYYDVQYQFVADGSEFEEDFWNYQTSYRPDNRDAVPVPPADLLNQYGNGAYYFRLRAISADITAAASSEWTDWTEEFNYTKPATTLTVSNLKWNGNTLSWTPSFGSDAPLAGYYIYLYDSADAASAQERNWDDRFWVPADETELVLDRDWLEDLMGQTWYFVVSTITEAPANASSNFGSAPVTAWTYQAPTTPAPAAYDLQWHTWRNDSGSNSDYQLGVISFGRTDTSMEQDFRVDFYRKEASGDKKIGELWTYLREGRPYRTMYPFRDLGDVFTTGTYYFTVTAMGDGATTCDGQPVRSGAWSYTRPNAKLSVSNAYWGTDMSINWTDAAQNDAYLDYYEVQYQYVGSGDRFETDRWNYGTSYRPGNRNDFPYPPADLMGDRGNGKYYFRVRAISNSINEAVYSDWTDWSEAFTYTRPATTLTVSDLKWEGNTLSWTPDFGKDAPLAGYQIYIYEKSSYAVSNPDAWWDWDSAPADATSYTMPKWMLEDLPDRTWYFAVTTISANPAAYNANYGSAATAEWTYQAPTTPAAAAYDLQWNTWRNNSGSDSDYELGAISFGRTDTDMEQEFRVDFYRKEASGDKKIGELWTNLPEGRPYRTMYPFRQLGDVFTTGTYYFTVTAMGDGATTCDGQPVTSGDWSYTRPEVKLGVSNAHWGTDMSINWTAAAQNDGYLDFYELRYQYVGPGDTFRDDNWDYGTSYRPGNRNDFPYPPADLMGDRGNGKYYFRIRALSNSINEAVYSDWSDWSEAFTYTRPATTLTVSDLKWEGNTLSWTPDFGKDAPLAGYRIYIYEDASYAVSNPDDWWDWDSVPADATSYTMPEWMLEDLSGRTWYFAVTTISANPAAYNSNYGSAATAEWTYQAPTTPAAAAYDLQWGVRRWQIGQSYEEPGVISFGGTVPQNADWAEFRVDIYRREADGNVKIGTFYRDLWSGDDFTYYQPFYEFADQFTTGTYYFTVTALGDGVNTCDGQPVTSPDWSYTRPDVTLGVSNPVWNSNMSIGWTDGAQNGDLLSHFDLEFRYVAPGESLDPNNWHDGSSYKPGSGDDPYPHADMLLENGSGTYYFRMRAMPEDVTCAVPSGWTEWSTGFAYTRPATTLTVSDLKWEGNTLSWTPDFDPATAPLLKYWIYVYENAGDAISWPWNNRTRYLLGDASATSFTLENRWIEDLEGRDWHFAVVTVTSDPNKANSNWGSAPTCKWTYTAPANKLGTPSELQWNVDYDTYWENNVPVQQTPFQRMGVISFRRAEVDQNQYEARIYRVGEDQPVQEMHWGYGSEDVSKYFAMSSFIYENHPSGEYYFTLRAYSDDTNYGHGDWVDSRDYPNGVWTYVKPADSNKLGTATGLRWDDRTFKNENGSDLIAARWFPVTGAGYYEVRTLFSPTKDGTPREIGTSFDIRANEPNLHSILNEWEIADYGNGWYYFQVRVISDDITRINNGDWSALSNPYPLGYVSEYVEDTVSSATDLVDNALTNSSATAQDKQAAAQVAVDAVAQLPQLNAVLSADTTNSETVAELKELEEKVAEVLNVTIAKPVISDPDLQQKMDVDAIQISNMALNVDTGSTAERSVQLKIDAVDENTAPPALNETLYKNTVEFSMKIEGAVDADETIPGHQLNVPVKMVLPVPAGINPHFLVVLHHKESDGSWEEIHPHVYPESGKWFATFVVDSFSNFSLAELTMTARNTGSGSVEISYNNLPAAAGEDGRYLVAVYSSDGQMLGMTMLNAGGDGTVTIQTGSEKDPAIVKLMTADAGNGWKPVDEIRPIEIRK